MYSVYIIYSQKIDKYYIGFSSNVQDRLLKHNRNSKGFSNPGKPWVLGINPHNPKTGHESDWFYFWYTFQPCLAKDIKKKESGITCLFSELKIIKC